MFFGKKIVWNCLFCNGSAHPVVAAERRSLTLRLQNASDLGDVLADVVIGQNGKGQLFSVAFHYGSKD